MTAKNWRAFLSSNTANRKLRLTEDEIVRRAAGKRSFRLFHAGIRWCGALAFVCIVAKKWFPVWFWQHAGFLIGLQFGLLAQSLVMLWFAFDNNIESELDVIEEHASRPNPL